MIHPMHILVVADGRSPTTHSWVRNLIKSGHKVSLISTFNCPTLPSLEYFEVIPVAFSRYAGGFSCRTNKRKGSLLSLIKSLFKLDPAAIQKIRYHLGPLDVILKSRRFKRVVRQIKPDLVHAHRIPFEGMLARLTPEEFPLVISSWGNDFTLHASSSKAMRRSTTNCLKRTNGFTADAKHDIQRAHKWGLPSNVPTLFIPGSGGIDIETIQAVDASLFNPLQFNMPEDRFWIVNARGFRPGYVHQDVFFAAVPAVVKAYPEALFICPGLEGFIDPTWVADPLSQENTIILPNLPQEQLWSLFKRCPLFISPSSHDGTPNSLLEAMLCGCFPVAGDIDSIRDWIEPGKNGFLVDPKDPAALANAINIALLSPELRRQAAFYNLEMVAQRAGRQDNQTRLIDFYTNLIVKNPS